MEYGKSANTRHPSYSTLTHFIKVAYLNTNWTATMHMILAYAPEYASMKNFNVSFETPRKSFKLK